MMIEEPAKRLLHRLLRIIDHNCELYIHHRKLGEYGEAVQRLQRAAKWANVVHQADQESRMQVSENDWAHVQLVRRHVQAMGGFVPER